MAKVVSSGEELRKSGSKASEARKIKKKIKESERKENCGEYRRLRIQKRKDWRE